MAVVLRDHGMSPAAIAIVFSTATVALVPATLLSGTLASRLGAAWTMRIGAVLSLISIAVLPFTVNSVLLAALATAGRGGGAAFFTPAGQLFAQAQVSEKDRAHAVGIFTAMFLIPTFYGPALAEWSLKHWGETGFFALPIMPMLIATLLVWRLPSIETPAPPSAAGYIALARDRRLWLPNMATAMSGLAYAFAFSFLPLLFTERRVTVALFFTPFAAALLTVRLVGLKYLQRLPVRLIVALGLLAYAIGLYALGALKAAAIVAPASGVLFAFGYGVMLPTCVVWSTAHYSEAERARPVALINTSFHLGSIVAVQLTGIALPLLGWPGVLASLGTIVAVVFLVAVASGTAAVRRSLSYDRPRRRRTTMTPARPTPSNATEAGSGTAAATSVMMTSPSPVWKSATKIWSVPASKDPPPPPPPKPGEVTVEPPPPL
jgi:MFS family permease